MIAPDRKNPTSGLLPRWHHDNPVRRAQRTKSLAAIRQLHSIRRNPFQNCRILSTSAPIVVVTNRNPLVMAIADHAGSLAFTIRDLKRHAKFRGPLQDAIVGIDLAIEFKKLNGHWIDGYCLKNIGPAGQGVALWRVYRRLG
jgi:hypothetical protein